MRRLLQPSRWYNQRLRDGFERFQDDEVLEPSEFETGQVFARGAYSLVPPLFAQRRLRFKSKLEAAMRRLPKNLSPRDKTIVALQGFGWPYARIAGVWKISRTRAHQIVRMHEWWMRHRPRK